MPARCTRKNNIVHTDFNLLIVPITGGASQFHKNTLIIYLYLDFTPRFSVYGMLYWPAQNHALLSLNSDVKKYEHGVVLKSGCL
jgi:hypothetical protein